MATTANFICRLESVVNKALRNVEGVDTARLDCERALLNIAKKRIGCDVMIANFSRRFVMSKYEADKVTQDRICKELLECSEVRACVEHCTITSPAGHLTFYLNRSSVVKDSLSNILVEGEDYGRNKTSSSLGVLLGDTVLLNDGTECQENLSLDQLRTTLLADHVKELLKWTGASVQLARPRNSSSESSVCDCMTIKQDILSAFVSSPPDIHFGKEKFADTRQEISVAINECGYVSRRSLEERDCLEETCTSCSLPCPVSTKHFNGDDNDEVTRRDIIQSVDVGQYLLDNKDQLAGYDKNIQKSRVSITENISNHVTCLETLARNVSQKQKTSLMLHVLPCKLQFRYQQIGLVWRMVSSTPLALNQVYLSHGSVSSSRDEPGQHTHVHVKELLEICENQLKNAFVLKYGDIVQGSSWQDSIRTMAISTLKLVILSASTSSAVKMNLSESAQEFRQATFVMYNCARLAKLFQKYEQNVCKGLYPALPHVASVDFSLLRDEAEWQLFLRYIFNFPSIVQEATCSARRRASDIAVQLQTHKISSFLFDLSHEFSSYYGRIHVLVEPREHLFPIMFARLYLMKAIQQVIHNCLRLLNIKPLMQM